MLQDYMNRFTPLGDYFGSNDFLKETFIKYDVFLKKIARNAYYY